MARWRHCFLVGVSAAAVAVSPAYAQRGAEATWPQFRGSNASGIAPGSASPPVEFGPSKHLLWKTSLPSGHSSPAVWGNRIFVTAFDTVNKKLEVIGLDRTSGQILWRQTVPAQELETIHEVGSPATATPAVDGERVYAYFGSYGIAAYDLEGKPVWEVPLPRVQNPFGSGTSPVVAGELVLLNRQEPKDPFLVALDRRTGKTVWKHKYEIPVGRVGPPYASYSTPVVAGQQVLVHGPTALEAFDLSTGHRQWWVTIRSAAASTPILAGDTVYVATWTGTGEADQMTPLPDFAALLRHDADGNGTLSLEEMPADLAVFSRPDMPSVPGAAMFVKPMFPRIADKDGQLQKEEWEAFRARMTQAVTEHGLLAVKTGGTGDVTDTHVLWKEKTSIPEVPSPIVYQNHVYMVRNGGIISCLDAAGGTLRYRARIGAPGPYYASPVAANGRLFVASGEGVVTVLAAGDRLDVLARNDLGEDILASPALVDGTLYIRTASALSAFGQK